MRPPLPGIGLPGVFTLTTVADAQAIRDYVKANDAHYGAVLGGGYIGLESVEALVALGLKASLIERLDRLMPVMSPEMTAPVLGHLLENGVQVHLAAEAEALLGGDRLTGIRLRGGEEVPADLLIVAAGVSPELSLAEQAGLEVDSGIVVDEHMQTSDPAIFAAGDVVVSRSLPGGVPVQIGRAHV